MCLSARFAALPSLRAALALAAVVLAVPTAQAQVCEGDITLNLQADADDFDCAEVTGDLRISGSVTDLSGLSELVTVGEYLYVGGNDLTSLEGLENLTTIGESLWIQNHPALINLDGLGGLTSLGGLSLYGNDVLEDITGLGGLTSMDGFFIALNDSLKTMSGFDNLTTVSGLALLSGNPALENIDALSSLTFVGSNLELRSNDVLSECTTGLGELLLNGEVEGSVLIAANAPGCNSVCEVQPEYEGCTVDTEDEAAPLVTALAAPYPNPSAGATSLAFTLAEPADVRLTVHDALGRRVATLVEEARPTGAHEASFGAGLPAGTYLVRFEAGDGAWTERVTLVR